MTVSDFVLSQLPVQDLETERDDKDKELVGVGVNDRELPLLEYVRVLDSARVFVCEYVWVNERLRVYNCEKVNEGVNVRVTVEVPVRVVSVGVGDFVSRSDGLGVWVRLMVGV